MTMQQKILPPEFGKDEKKPFDGDLLNREGEIKSLTPMICNIKSPATMALDAEWGAGKTAFIKMWAAYLNKPAAPNNEASARAFYFNAWETDFAADPLMPFVETITAQLPKGKHRKLKDSAKALIPIVIGDFAGKVAGGGLAKVAESAAESLFSHRSKLTEFKDALGEFIESQDKRIVIFVDELDRCRPDYAVKVLERIKHLFEVPGVVFVLATNREQLCHSINALYGANFNADAYLRRFIEFDYTIKQPDMARFISARLNGLGIDAFLLAVNPHANHFTFEELHKMLTLLAKVYDFSLRDMEQLLMRVVLVLRTLERDADGGYPVNPTLLAFLVMARLQMREHYNKYIRDADWQGIVNRWEGNFLAASARWRNENERAQWHINGAFATAQVIMARFFVMSNYRDSSELIVRYQEKAANAHSDEQGYYHEVVRFIGDIRDNSSHGINVRGLVNKIEMLDQFRFPDADNTKNSGN